ncbi:hypothetical protein TrRE_jg4385 [Triparma retinervis]|uniref:Uncharacterized protein n=1 Tax=Triparma retinervis TaxID=2557542 RepID=A0A9W7DXK9_9STRA|nr:hypothetical protein TrRE_jg4385 [Triparma retinervis]
MDLMDNIDPSPNKRLKRETTETKGVETTKETTGAETKAEKAARLKASVKERLAKAKKLKEAKAAAAAKSTLPGFLGGSKKAKVFELDMSDTTATVGGVALKNQPDVVAAKERKAAKEAAKAKSYNPYLEKYEDDEDDMGYDESVKYKDNFRPNKKRGAFNWVKEGQVVKEAEWRKAKDEEVKKAGYGTGRKLGRDDLAAAVEDKGPANKEDIFGGGGAELDVRSDVVGRYPLVVEWWDMETLNPAGRALVEKAEKAREGRILASKTKKGRVKRVNLDIEEVEKGRGWKNIKTAKLVQHPVPVKPLGWKDKSSIVPTVYLTEKERKRQRRLNRAAKLQEQRDAQALGLVDAPEAKLTLGNFMKVMGDSAVMDPSKMEQAVRKQVQARLDKHHAENEARKLTPAEKKAKKEEKRREDTTEGVKVAAWWVKDLTHKLLRAKVDLNAAQYNLSGVVVERGVNGGGYVVVVEGGPKGVNKFKRLMEVRIKWRGEGMEDSSSEEDSDEEGGEGEGARKSRYNRANVCNLLWQGGAPNRKFQGFEFKIANTEGEARKVLKEYGNLVGQQGGD